MEKVGVLIVSYGARETAMVDAFARSSNHNVKLYIADKQRNPFNKDKAAEHAVIPDLKQRQN
jgi:phosphoribosylamine-glycine ligase